MDPIRVTEDDFANSFDAYMNRIEAGDTFLIEREGAQGVIAMPYADWLALQPSSFESTVIEDPETGEALIPLPASLLDRMGWKIGDQLVFTVIEEGRVEIRKAEPGEIVTVENGATITKLQGIVDEILPSSDGC